MKYIKNLFPKYIISESIVSENNVNEDLLKIMINTLSYSKFIIKYDIINDKGCYM